MAGRHVPAQAHLLAPLGIVARQSTDVLAIDDPHIAAAVRFIREHACDGINAADVLPHVPWSRRAFEARFRKLLGKSPHEMLVAYRLERVRKLLVETSLPLEQVADRAGFTHVEYLSAAFRRHFGQPPGAYRQQMQSD
jgi:LacI family transcriptional regulator